MKRPSGRHPLEIRGLSKSYSAASVVKNFTASVSRGEKIGLLGRNGVGKTTLLRSLIANAPGAADEPFDIDSGTIEWGHEVQVGYLCAGPSRDNPARPDGSRLAAGIRSDGR